jgi:hypothetical protein
MHKNQIEQRIAAFRLRIEAQTALLKARQHKIESYRQYRQVHGPKVGRVSGMFIGPLKGREKNLINSLDCIRKRINNYRAEIVAMKTLLAEISKIDL